MSAGIRAALAGRSDVVGITADDPAEGISCAYHQWWDFHSASIVKVIILGALLHELQLEHSDLTAGQLALAQEMITESDDAAATTLWNEVGMTSLQDFLTAAGMTHTELGQDGYWGLTEVNAHDELILLRLLLTSNPVLDSSGRGYELGLMADVVASQRWGVSAGAAADVTMQLKDGWMPDPSLWVINSIGDFADDDGDYSMAILTMGNPSMDYGVDTVQAVAQVINGDLDRQ